MPLAAGIVIGIGDVALSAGGGSLSGIALGSIVVILGYHLLRRLAPAPARDEERERDDEPTP